MHRLFSGRKPRQRSHYAQPYANGTFEPSWPAEASTSRHHEGALHHGQPTNMSYHGHNSYNDRPSPGQVDFINEMGDEAFALEEVAKEAVFVLRLKHAITQLADIVDLYDAVDRATGCKAVLTLAARH